MTWTITKVAKKKLNKPVLIVGLPGIGNVGKVAVDYLIDKMSAEKLVEFFSYSFPHSVFVNEDNLVELPNITLHVKKRGKGPDILFLAGDVQPTEEEASYQFSEAVLNLMEEYGCSEIITLGGIGLPAVPREPKVYITGNDKDLVAKHAKASGAVNKLYGIVGPIIGASGLLLGMSRKRNIPAVCYLAETFGHPMYLGMRGSRAIVECLNKSLSLGVSISQLDKEISEIEKETQEGEMPKQSKYRKLKDTMHQQSDINYIG